MTLFLDSSKAHVQSSINLANEFFLFNDIFINGLKCELLVINPSVLPKDHYVMIGQERMIIKDTHKEIRYLGVWFSKKKTNKLIITSLKDIVALFNSRSDCSDQKNN